MLVGTDSTWRWKLGGGRDWRLASFYGRFWSRAVQYLSGSLELKKVRFAPLPDRLTPREPLILSVRVFDEHFRPLGGSQAELRLVWTGPDGASRPVASFEREPGLFQLELTGLGEGRHAVRAFVRRGGQPWGEDAVEFSWEPPRGDAPADRRALRAFAEGTGGLYLDLERADASEVLALLPSVRRERAVLEREPLWPHPAWLLALCAVLGLEWFLRRRAGLL